MTDDVLETRWGLSYDRLVDWNAALSALTTEIAGPLFNRPEPRVTFADFVRGLLADVNRKNAWQLADHLGHANPGRIEWLLNGAAWDADALRDRVRDYVMEHLGSPDGVLIADDTQVIKQGDKSVGVARQYCGLTGQVENCQVLPMLSYASDLGHAFIDRRLYIPQVWMDDPERCARAGIPADLAFGTKPELVVEMLAAAIASGVVHKWFAADSGYGRDPKLRAFCHVSGIRYVMAIPVDLPLVDIRKEPTRPDRILKRYLDADDFERRSCGAGSKGQRFYDWAVIKVNVKDQEPAEGFGHDMLVRRSIADPTDAEFFLVHAPHETPRTEMLSVAGMRWKIEDCNGETKDLLGLDQYQVRKWTPWHRHVTTCMLAHAFLAVQASSLGKATAVKERMDC
jgi:SRSO17 transposase